MDAINAAPMVSHLFGWKEALYEYKIPLYATLSLFTDVVRVYTKMERKREGIWDHLQGSFFG
jgi:hypothetical protein